jgi:hypothetical protein
MIQPRLRSSFKRKILNTGKKISEILGGIRFIDFYFLQEEDFYLVVHINPHKINKAIRDRVVWNSGFIKYGKWDKNQLVEITDVGNNKVIKDSLIHIYINGYDYKESAQFVDMNEKLKTYKVETSEPQSISGLYWCKNTNDIHLYFTKLDGIMRQIIEGNYLSQMELREINPEKEINLRDEIQVYITSDGEFVFGRGGTHRLLISQLFKIEKVPVIIRGIHYKYAKKIIKGKTISDIEKSIIQHINNNQKWNLEQLKF